MVDLFIFMRRLWCENLPSQNKRWQWKLTQHKSRPFAFTTRVNKILVSTIVQFFRCNWNNKLDLTNCARVAHSVLREREIMFDLS